MSVSKPGVGPDPHSISRNSSTGSESWVTISPGSTSGTPGGYGRIMLALMRSTMSRSGTSTTLPASSCQAACGVIFISGSTSNALNISSGRRYLLVSS